MAQVNTDIDLLKARMWKKEYYVIFRKLLASSKIAEVMLEHYQWIIDLEKQDKVFASGPLFEKNGSQGVGMTVLRVKNFEEAERIAAQDPFVLCGAMEARIERWQVNEGRINVTVDFSDQTYSMS